jgi:hypothetical protein
VEHESIVMSVLEEQFPGIIAEVEADDDSVDEDSTTGQMAEESNINDVAALRDALENMLRVIVGRTY